MGTERGERRHRGAEEARDDVRLQARGEVRRQRVKERRRSGGGDNDGEGEVKGCFPLHKYVKENTFQR